MKAHGNTQNLEGYEKTRNTKPVDYKIHSESDICKYD
jgi:hypothetical protein